MSRPTLRRLTATSVVALALAAGGLPTLAGAAQAATGTVSSVSPRLVHNTYGPTTPPSTTFTFSLSGPSVAPGPGTVSLSIVRSGGTETLTPTGAPVATNPGTDGGSRTVTAAINLALAAPGDYDVTITETQQNGVPTEPADVFSCSRCLTVTAFAPSYSSFRKTANSDVPEPRFTLTGENFARGMKVEFLQNGVPDPGVVLSAPMSLTATSVNYDVTTANALAGVHDIRLTNTDGKSSLCTACFTIPRPSSITRVDTPGVTPANLGRRAVAQDVAVVGGGFTPTTSVNVFRPTSLTSAGSVTVDKRTVGDASGFVATFTVDQTAEIENRRIVFVNPDGGFYVATDALKINAAPEISWSAQLSSGPVPRFFGQNARPGDDSKTVVASSNSGFQPGVRFEILPANQGISVASVVRDSAGQATLQLVVSRTATVGSYSLKAINPDGGFNRPVPTLNSAAQDDGSCSGCLTVNPGPRFRSSAPVSPAFASRGSTPTLAIAGTTLRTSSTASTGTVAGQVLFPQPDSGISTTGATTFDSDSSTLRQPVAISALTMPGSRDVAVRNADRGYEVCVACFTLDPLSVGTPSPVGAANDTDGVRIMAPGAGFLPGATLRLERPGFDPIVGRNVVVSGPTSIEGLFDLKGRAPGGWTLRVTNTDQSSGFCAGCFTLTSNDPTVASVSPTSLPQGAQQRTLTVTGTNFAEGSTIDFNISNDGRTAVTDITVVSARAVTRTTLEAVVNIAPGAQTGPRPFTVRNTNAGNALPPNNPGESAIFNGFSVSSAPGLQSVNPASRASGSPTFTMTLTGTNFSGVQSVVFSGFGVTAGAPSTTSPTTATAPVTVSAGAAAGPRDVTVTNADGGKSTCVGCFTVLAPPAISTVAPGVVAKGARVTFVIDGVRFATPTVTVTFGAGITADGMGRVNNEGTRVTVDATVAAGAARGPVAVTVTNPDTAGAGSASCPDCIRVAVPPSAPEFTAVTPGDSKVDLAWTAPTDDGGAPVTSYTVSVSNAAGRPNGTVTITGTTATVTGLTNGTLYGFVVTATNAVGTGTPSNGRTATPGKIPAAPTNVAAQPGNAEASVSWTAPDNGGSQITKYTITASPGGVTKVVTGAPAPTSGTVTGLTNGTAYTFTVVATNGIGDGPVSAPSAAVTPTEGRPGAPTALVATVDRAPGTADLSWTAPAGTITSYRVEVTPAAGTVTYPANRAATTAVVTGLANGTAYTFRVFATTAGGEGAGSTATEPVTPYDVPGAPTALAGSGDGGDLAVTWTAPAANGRPITSYTLVLTPAEGTITYPSDRSQTGATVTGLTPGRDYAASVVATNARGNGAAATATLRSNVTTPQGRFVGLPSPVRVLDSRPSSNVGTAPGAKRGAVTLDLSSRLPAAASGAVLNVTVTAPDRGGFVVVYPAGATKPPTSNVNFAAGQTQANEVVTALNDRKATVFVDTTGSTQLIVDVVGYFTNEAGSAGYLVPTTPKRVLGEALARNVGSSSGSSSVDVDLTSALPTGATGAVLNVTVASPTAAGFVVAYPSGTSQPATSNVNFGADQVQANEVVTLLGAGNKVRLTLSRGQARLIVDVVGAIVPSSATGAKRFTALPAPVRALDTRDGTGTTGTARRSASSPVELTLPSAVPADATGVILNVTSTSQVRSGYVVVFPTGTTMPGTSNVNFRQGVNQANEVLVGIGTGRKVTLAVGGGANPESHVIADVVGYLR